VSLASLMPRHRSDHFRQSIRHVQAEARVVSAFAHLNSILEEGEAVTDGGGADGQELLDSWTTVRHQVSEMLSGEHGELRVLDILLINKALCTRTTSASPS
jgi:hypothetical protein